MWMMMKRGKVNKQGESNLFHKDSIGPVAVAPGLPAATLGPEIVLP